MPDWLLAPICLIVLVGFIRFAFRQGLKVKPDRENRDNWNRFGSTARQSSGKSKLNSGAAGQRLPSQTASPRSAHRLQADVRLFERRAATGHKPI